MKTILICSNCILPDNFPGVTLNNDGICNHCQTFEGRVIIGEQQQRYENQFVSLIEQNKGKSEYDCLMCYSGGKDSTYTMDILKERYGLSILAVTFDNGFIAPAAMDNMRVVVENIGVDHLIFKARFDILKKIFSAASTSELYSKKTLERASTICTSCITFVKFTSLKIALEKSIPFIGFGWSPGQAPIQSSVMKNNPSMLRMTQKTVFDPLYKIVGDAIRPYFLSESYFTDNKEFPYNVHPLAFCGYNEENIYDRMKELGWNKPDDTDPNSTNCLLNAFANDVHKRLYGFNPYVFEIAKMVREGIMARELGLKRFEESPSLDQIHRVMERLGISE